MSPGSRDDQVLGDVAAWFRHPGTTGRPVPVSVVVGVVAIGAGITVDRATAEVTGLLRGWGLPFPPPTLTPEQTEEVLRVLTPAAPRARTAATREAGHL